MTPRRPGRAAHVRPRPPSDGRPAPKKVPLKNVDRYRATPLRSEKRRRALPLPARLLLGLAVAGLGVVVFAAATGGIGTLMGALGRSFGGLFDDILATPKPSATDILVSDSPLITQPDEPYTNQATVDLEIALPEDVVGNPAASVRIYLTLEGQSPAPITQVGVGAAPRLIVPIDLTPGRNDFTATIVEGDIESEPSPVVTFILDLDPPPIKVSSPKDGQTINAEVATIVGTTQGRSSLIARNEANGISVAGTAGSDGSFSVVLPLEPGPNGVKLTVTDPAGNVGELIFGVVRGSGRLSATLSASAYRISQARLPATIQLAVLVTDPDGQPLEGATVTFSLTVPGIPPLTFDTLTAGDGRAVFSTTLPKDVTPGSGNATVLVTTDVYGSATDQTVITIVP